MTVRHTIVTERGGTRTTSTDVDVHSQVPDVGQVSVKFTDEGIIVDLYPADGSDHLGTKAWTYPELAELLTGGAQYRCPNDPCPFETNDEAAMAAHLYQECKA